MKRYAIAIDITRCDGCGSCFLACKDEYTGNDHPPYSVAQPNHGHKWLNLREVEQGAGSKVKMDYIPVMCQHCENPVCAEGAPEGAVYTRPDGVVILDPVKAKGRKDMVESAPTAPSTGTRRSAFPRSARSARTVGCRREDGPLRGILPDPGPAFRRHGRSEQRYLEIPRRQARPCGRSESRIGTKPRVRYIDLPNLLSPAKRSFPTSPASRPKA